MKLNRPFTLLLLLVLSAAITSCRRPAPAKDYLLLFTDSVNGNTGYRDAAGNIIILPGKYENCFTDTFRTYAVVANKAGQFVAIDRKENVLYEVFSFDNGPDYISEGLFRIIKGNKTGFADSATGKIVIAPRFECAYAFENGVAKVSEHCVTSSEEEHEEWQSDEWYYIDRTGKRRTGPAAK